MHHALKSNREQGQQDCSKEGLMWESLQKVCLHIKAEEVTVEIERR